MEACYLQGNRSLYEKERHSSQQAKRAALKARTSQQNVPLSVQYAAACVHQTLA